MKQKGFTLIELVIVIAILAVLSAIVLPVLQSGFNAYFTERNLVDANWQGSLALSRMTRDIRDIPSTSGISVASATQFTFTDDTNNAVSYTLSGSTLFRNGIALANGVNSVTFGYYSGSGAATASIVSIRYVTITLNITENATNLTLFATVNLRNVD